MHVTKIMLLLFAFSFGWSQVSTAQKAKKPNFSEGVIEYKIEMEGMPEVGQMLNSTTMKIFFKEQNSKVDLAILGGMMSVEFINNKKDDISSMLMNIPSFYERVAVDFDEDSDVMKELMQAQKEDTAQEQVDVQYYKGKRKRIAKYPCYLSEVEAGGQKVKVYLTEKLRPEAAVNWGTKDLSDFKGFPMAFEIEIEGMTLKITAVDVKKETVDAETFDIPESYTRKSLDEFVQEMKEKASGMGNGTIGL